MSIKGIAKLVLLLVFVVFLYGFTARRHAARKVNEIHIAYVGTNNVFITEESVNKLLIQNGDSLTGIRKDEVDLNRLEHILNAND